MVITSITIHGKCEGPDQESAVLSNGDTFTRINIGPSKALFPK